MDTALLILHVVVGLLFAGHGAQKLLGAFGGDGIAGTAEYLESLGLRPGRPFAVLAGSAELAGGVLLTLGLLIPLAAMLLTGVMVTAALTDHRGKPIFNDAGGAELPLTNVAALFALAVIGGGEASLDAALGLDVQGLVWGAAAVGAGALGALVNLAVVRLEPGAGLSRS